MEAHYYWPNPRSPVFSQFRNNWKHPLRINWAKCVMTFFIIFRSFASKLLMCFWIYSLNLHSLCILIFNESHLRYERIVHRKKGNFGCTWDTFIISCQMYIMHIWHVWSTFKMYNVCFTCTLYVWLVQCTDHAYVQECIL